jgi:hypothetical protein
MVDISILTRVYKPTYNWELAKLVNMFVQFHCWVDEWGLYRTSKNGDYVHQRSHNWLGAPPFGIQWPWGLFKEPPCGNPFWMNDEII